MKSLPKSKIPAKFFMAIPLILIQYDTTVFDITLLSTAGLICKIACSSTSSFTSPAISFLALRLYCLTLDGLGGPLSR